eukprot:6202682-Pleurochrysis_carterae.AAC.4
MRESASSSMRFLLEMPVLPYAEKAAALKGVVEAGGGAVPFRGVRSGALDEWRAFEPGVAGGADVRVPSSPFGLRVPSHEMLKLGRAGVYWPLVVCMALKTKTDAAHRVMPYAVCRLLWAAQAWKRAATAARPGPPWPTWPRRSALPHAVAAPTLMKPAKDKFSSCTNKARSWSNLTGGTLQNSRRLPPPMARSCLLYTSDAADDTPC